MGGNFSFTPELVKIHGPVYPDFTILIQAFAKIHGQVNPHFII